MTKSRTVRRVSTKKSVRRPKYVKGKLTRSGYLRMRRAAKILGWEK
jgi:hypothetical protein